MEGKGIGGKGGRLHYGFWGMDAPVTGKEILCWLKSTDKTEQGHGNAVTTKELYSLTVIHLASMDQRCPKIELTRP